VVVVAPIEEAFTARAYAIRVLRLRMILTEQIVPPPALVRAGLETLPMIIRAQGERAGRRFIEFFTATLSRAGWGTCILQLCLGALCELLGYREL
jgi:hypothetical protein